MMHKKQHGYFLLIAVIFIFVIGVMGSLMAYILSSRANLSVAQQGGLRAFYMAESGLEIGARLLTMPKLTGTPSRITCDSVTGTSAITNAALSSGRFTLTTVNSSPVFATDTLNGAITSTSTIITVGSVSGFAPSGRIIIDNEAMDYADISGNSFIGVTRGTAGTLAASHISGAGVGQYQCSLDSQAGIPSLAAPSYKRELQTNVQLQEGWVVGAVSGNNFVTSHWNRPTEEAWTASTLAGGSNAAALNAVSMLSNADGWAVGDKANNNFIYLRWNGSAWTSAVVASTCEQNLNGVSMVSSRQGFAVGVRYRATNCGSGNYRFMISYWNGSSWTVLTPTTTPKDAPDGTTAASTPNLNAVHVIDTDGDGLGNIGFAVGASGIILRYNGTDWVVSAAEGTITSKALNAVYTVSAAEAWVVGASGTILKWNGTSWSDFDSPVNNNLNGIAMLDTDNDGAAEFGVAVGASGKILTYNGSSWSAVDMGNTALNAVAIVDTQDVWVAGASGALYHYDGSSWTSVSSGVSQALNGIALVASKQNPTSAWSEVFR